MRKRLLVGELKVAERVRICNGVGPAFAQRMFRWLWKDWQDWKPNREFYEVARQHDLDYWVGGGLLEKWTADNAFLAGCMLIAMQHKGWRKWALCFLATVYGWAVKSLLGWFAWRFGRRTEEELAEVCDA